MKDYTNTGISLMILTTFLFSCMDGVSKYLAENNNVISLVAFRYWFVLIGLVETHAIIACYPLIVAGLSVPFLGEKFGWRRWSAIAFGFIGVIIILRPGFNIFQVDQFSRLLVLQCLHYI